MPPEYLSVDDFRAAVTRLAELRAAGKSWLLVSTAGVNFVFAQEVRDDELRRRSDEVEDAIQALISDQPAEVFAKRYDSPFARLIDEGTRSDDVEAAQSKLETAKTAFDVAELRRRQWLKRTTKNGIPATIEWEVGVKHSDDRLPRPPGGPMRYAVLRVAEHPPDPSNAGHDHPDVVLTLDDEDIRFIEGVLADLHSAYGATGEA